MPFLRIVEKTNEGLLDDLLPLFVLVCFVDYILENLELCLTRESKHVVI